MKQLNIFVFLIIVSFFSENTNANRYVWIHGVKNDDSCWKIYDDAFTKNISIRTKYDPSANISSIATSISNTSSLSSRSDNILIAHSVGGFVAREIELANSSNVKGIITIGTPHSGVKQDRSRSGIDVTYRELKAKLEDASNASSLATIPVIGNAIVSMVFKNAEEKYAKNLPFISVGSSPNYSEFEMIFFDNSSYLKNFENKKVKAPVLCFATEEDRWQLARTLYCNRNIETLKTNANINSTGSYDQTGYNELNQIANNCNIMGGTHTALAAVFIALGAFVSPWYFIPAGTNTIAAIFWFDSGDYINNKLDINHAKYVGAIRYEERTDCRKILFFKSCTVKTYEIPEPHDGIIASSAQLLDKTKGTNVIHATNVIKNVNHMEQFNHKNTKEEFRKVLNGESYRPDIFKK